MRPSVGLFALVALCIHGALASVFLPQSSRTAVRAPALYSAQDFLSSGPRNPRRTPIAGNMKGTAMAIPGYGVAEQVVVGGFSNFLSIYNIVITGRILLTWIPQAQGVGFLQPLYQITDPYLNLFRGIIPPIGGLDLSPILAFFFLSFLGNVTMAVGAEIPDHVRQKMSKRGQKFPMVMPAMK